MQKAISSLAEMAILTSEIVKIAQEISDLKQKLKWMERSMPKHRHSPRMQKWASDAQPHIVRVKELGERAVQLQNRVATLMQEAGLPVPVDAMEETQKALNELLAQLERWGLDDVRDDT